MSSILKALKKLEAEKAARHGEPVDIAREVARGESAASPSHRRVPVMTVALALLVGAVIAITAALLLWPRGGVTPANEAKPAATTPAPVQTQQEFSLPTPGQAITQPTEQQVTITMPPASRPAQPAPLPLPVPAPGTVTNPPKESQPPTSAPAASQPTPQQSQPALRPLPGEPELKANIPAVTEPGHSKLVVSGIAWQKDSADRLAIINGHPVRIGTTIDGAVVEEILPDRVRFSRNKQPFEVLWGAK